MKKIMFFLTAVLIVFSTAFAQEAKTKSPSLIKALQLDVAGGHLKSLHPQNDAPNRAQGDVILFENFDATTFPPTGWNRFQSTGTNTWVRSTTYAYGGTGGCAYHQDFNWSPNTRTSYLVTPAITIPAGQQYILEYMSRIDDFGGYYYYSGIHVSTTVNNTMAAFTELEAIDGNSYTSEVWQERSVDLSAFHGKTIYIAFVYTAIYSHDWRVDDVAIIDDGALPPYDSKITPAIYPYSQVPLSQPLAPTLSAKIENAGSMPLTNVGVSLAMNGTTIGTTTPIPSFPTGSAPINVSIATGSPDFILGVNTLDFTVSQTEPDNVPGNNTASLTVKGTTDTYAVDNVTTYTDPNGIGSNSGTITMGNIFEFTNTAILTDVEVAFGTTSTALNYSISLYKMTGNLMTNNIDLLGKIPAVREPGGPHRISLPETPLMAGESYFICLNQLTTTNLGLMYESHPDKILYVLSAVGDGSIYDGNKGYSGVVRMIVRDGNVYTITTNVTPEGAGTVKGAGNYVENASVTLTASPKTGYEFIKWSDGTTANPYIFPATADVTITAIFAEELGACDEIQIGAGTQGSCYYPVCTYYDNSYTQLLYDADEIGEGTRITSISFQYISSTPQTKNNLSIYLGNTGKTAFANTSDWVPINELELVYTGSVNFSNGWVTITFDAPFAYSGCNLVVGILNNHNGYTGGSTVTFNNHATTLHKMLCLYQDTNTINPASPPAAAGMYGFDFYRANTKFEICSPMSCNEVAITLGTVATNYTLPTNNLYNHSYTQQIYDAAEIGLAPGTPISSIAFLPTHSSSNVWTKTNQAIYLANIGTKSTFTSATDLIPVGQLVEVVAPRTIPFNHNANPGWQVIDFDNTFIYDGENIAVIFINNHTTYQSANTFRTGSTTGGTKATGNYSDTYIYSPGNAGGSSATYAYRNHISFSGCGFGMGGTPVDLQAVSITGPGAIPALDQANYTITIKNNGLNPAKNYVVKLLTAANVELGSTTVAATLISGGTTQVTIPVIFQPAMVGPLSIKGRVEMFCDAVPANDETPLFAINIMSECTDMVNTSPLTIGAGTTAVRSYPIDYYYGNSYTQQIFLASELDLPVGAIITSLSFQHTFPANFRNNQTVYLANTTKVSFGGTTATEWITPATGLQPVFSGQINMEGGTTAEPTWVTIKFDAPFVYNGQNLVVAFQNLHGSYTGSTGDNRYLAHATGTDNRVLYYYSDGTAPNVTTPPAASGRATTRNNMIFNMAGTKVFTLNPNNIVPAGTNIKLVPMEGILCGESGTVFFETDDCAIITDVKFDGVSMGTIISYDFINRNTPLPLIEIVAYVPDYTIVATSGPNGTIIPIGTVTLPCGSTQTFQLKPDQGYTVASLTVDGEDKPVPANRKYTFSNLIENHTIHVEFVEFPQRIITFVAEPEFGGEIIPVGREDEASQGYISVDSGAIYQQFLFVPAEHYTIQAVYIDGLLSNIATFSGSYIFTNITTDHHIKVIFKIDDINILATAGANGTISPAGNVPVPYGSDQQFIFTPTQGYIVDQVFVDNVEVPGAAQIGYYDFLNVQEPHTIYVTFKKSMLILHVSWTAGGGYVEPVGNNYHDFTGNSGDVYVYYNDTQKLLFAPNEGYKVVMVYRDGVPAPNDVPTGSSTFYYITESHSFFVEFEKYTYPITAQINANGVISDVGTTNVEHGSDKTYNFYALGGYKIDKVYVDGVNKPAAIVDGYYTFSNVIAPHTISVITAPMVYTINAAAGVGGYITPTGDVNVTYGGNQAFTFTALPGYKLEMVHVDGLENQEAVQNGAFAFINVNANHTIYASFSMLRFFIEASVQDNGGVIDPIGITEITYFDELTYTITPADDYSISYVLVNGENLGPIESYTFSEVLANGNIQAFFSPNEPVIVTDPTLDGIYIYSHTNIVYIVNENNLSINDVQIMDMYGRVVWQGKPQGQRIELNVANGIYTVRVTADNNFTTAKVSIQK